MQVLFIHDINDSYWDFWRCFLCIILNLDGDLTDYKRTIDKQSYELTEMFVYLWLREEITILVWLLCLVANCHFLMGQKMRNVFFVRKAAKGHQKGGKKMCEWRRSLYLNQFSLLFMPVLLYGCLWGALYWSLVSDDDKYKLPFMQIHYLLEALVSPQLWIYVTKNPKSAGLWWSWRPVAPLALAVQEFPFYYLRFITLHFFGLVYLSYFSSPRA